MHTIDLAGLVFAVLAVVVTKGSLFVRCCMTARKPQVAL